MGLLTRSVSDGSEAYRFVYLKTAENLDGFQRLPGLPDLHRVYDSEELFPLFRNRQMPRRRPDYPAYVRKLALDVETDPFEVMARNEGRKLTDRIEVFAPPSRNRDGNLTSLFFARGIRYRYDASDVVTGIRPGDRLVLTDEPDNEVNSMAIHLDTRGGLSVGWVPDYLVDTIHELRCLAGEDTVSVTAEHVNPPDVAPYMRLICRLTAPWPRGYQPFSGPDFQPITA